MPPHNPPSRKTPKAAASTVSASPPPAPPSPRETRRRRLRKLLAGLGIFTAGGLSAYLFQPGENADNVEPTPTARLDPSLNEMPDTGMTETGITSSIPNAVSFQDSLLPKRNDVKPESGTDGVYPLEMTVFDFLDKFVIYNPKDPALPLGYGAAYYLYSDLSQGPDDDNAPLPPDLKPLVVSGESKQRVRVIIKPLGDNGFYDRIFGNLEIYIGSPDKEENRRARDAVAMLGAMIDKCSKGMASDFVHDESRGGREVIRDPRTVVANSVKDALSILEQGTRSTTDADTIGALISATPSPKSVDTMRRRFASLFNEELSPGRDIYEETMEIRKDPFASPMVLKATDCLREAAELIASYSKPKEKKPARPR